MPENVPTSAEYDAFKVAENAANAAILKQSLDADSAQNVRLATLETDVTNLKNAVPGGGPVTPAPTTVAVPGLQLIDSFAGADFTAKLQAALTYAAAQTYKPYLGYGVNRNVSNKPIKVYGGMRIGPAFPAPVEQVRGGNPYAGMIKCNVSGAFFQYPSGQTHGTSISGVYEGNPDTIWVGGAADAVVWTSVYRDVGLTNFKHILGSDAQKLLVTMSTFFDGHCNINNSYGTAIHVGGSDCSFFTGARSNIDSPTGFLPATGSKYHVWFDSQQKTSIGDVYITAEGGWSGIRVSGNGMGLNFHGTVSEGRNAGAPCNGFLISHEGGEAAYSQVTTNYGKGSSLIQVTGGYATFDLCGGARANGVTEATPVITRTGGTARVRNYRQYGTWASKPLVKGAGAQDDSVATA